jgi:FixJ family two-component response regulator
VPTSASGPPLPAKVAIVDDDEDVRFSLESLVEAIGYRAAGFDAAEDFLASCEMGDLACVVTDLQMPGMSGLQLAAHIRDTSAVPVILITAFPAPGLEEQARAAGVRCTMRKPFDPEALIRELDRILS